MNMTTEEIFIFCMAMLTIWIVYDGTSSKKK